MWKYSGRCWKAISDIYGRRGPWRNNIDQWPPWSRLETSVWGRWWPWWCWWSWWRCWCGRGPQVSIYLKKLPAPNISSFNISLRFLTLFLDVDIFENIFWTNFDLFLHFGHVLDNSWRFFQLLIHFENLWQFLKFGIFLLNILRVLEKSDSCI